MNYSCRVGLVASQSDLRVGRPDLLCPLDNCSSCVPALLSSSFSIIF